MLIMKKCYLLLVVLSIFVLFSCKKDERPVLKEENTYNVNLMVSDLIVSTEILKNGNTRISSDDSLAKHANYLYSIVKDNTGKILYDFTSHPVHSQLSLRLKPGRYIVELAASQQKLFLYRPAHIPAPGIYYSYIGPDSGDWSDTFCGSFGINVLDSDITKTVKLQRVVGALELNITNTIPANVAKISLSATETYPSVFMDGIVNVSFKGTDVKTFTLAESDKNAPNKKFLMYVATQSPSINMASTVTIRAYDAIGNILAEKVIIPVPLRIGSITKISGDIFSSTAQSTVTVDPIWAPGTVVSF